MNSKCSMALVRKPCPRKRFPCSRCGAKIVNAGLQWEISVPKYQEWYYLNSLTMTPNGAATASPIVFYADRLLPYFSEETQALAPCKFNGQTIHEGVYILSGETPATAPQFVQDFNWQQWDDDVAAWVFFARSHALTVNWEAATVEPESGDLITPGGWLIYLKIVQVAMTYQGVDIDGDPVHANIAPGEAGYSIPPPSGEESNWGLYGNSLIENYYRPPADFKCFSRESTRWTRPVPTLPVIQNTPYTIDTLPPGYQWDDAGDVITGISQGPFYPIGFNAHDYWAPPYIDVRHIPK